MHSDADFLAAVAANPHDQLTRLVYADWLDEQGDPRGELVRIEEEVRFEPAWSDALWSQKPRRNELRALCDPAWLQAMRYGTDCLPLFYGRPFPDHWRDGWRDGWRLIREATERWLGHPMPDVGGHADEVAAAENRLGLTLPPSVREFVAFAHDMFAHQQGKTGLFRDGYSMVEVPDQPAISLIRLAEGTAHWAVLKDDLGLPDPPVHIFVDSMGEAPERFVPSLHPPDPTTSEFLFLYALSNATRIGGSLELHFHGIMSIVDRLENPPFTRTKLRASPTFSTTGQIELFEAANLLAYLQGGRFSVGATRAIPFEDIPRSLRDLIGTTRGSGVFNRV